MRKFTDFLTSWAVICALTSAVGIPLHRADAEGPTALQNAKLFQILQSVSIPQPQFLNSCLASIDQAEKNGFQEFAGTPLQELRSKISQVHFFSVPEPYHFDFEINEGQSALCVNGTGTTPPSVYLDSNATEFLSSPANQNPALEANLCLHEAFCALGDGDENYSASLLLNDMAYNRNSPLLRSPELTSQIAKSLLQNGQRIQKIISHVEAAQGTGTSIGGGGDLNSLMIKETLLTLWSTRELYAAAMKALGHPLPIDYDSLLSLILDCDFDLVDFSSILNSRPNLMLSGREIKDGIYPVQYVPPLNRMYFYIDQSVYNGLTSGVPKEKLLSALEPFYDALFSDLNELHQRGFTTCDLPQNP